MLVRQHAGKESCHFLMPLKTNATTLRARYGSPARALSINHYLCALGGGSWSWITLQSWIALRLTGAWQSTPLLFPAKQLPRRNARFALQKSILLLRFSPCFPLSCQLLARLRAWLLPPCSAISVLGFGSDCLVP